MVRLAVIAFLVAGVASPAPNVVHGYGMSLTVPAGWHGSVTHGLVRLRGEGVKLWIRETSSTRRPDPFFRHRLVPMLHESDFRSVEHHLGFTLSGRRFSLLPFPARPSTATLGAVNAALRSFTVKPGNYYGQRLPPAGFQARPGWSVGSRGGKLLAEGGQTSTWAATVPYRDPPLQIPPSRTLTRLQGNGIIIWVSLSRDSALRVRPVNSLRIRPRLIGNNFEGLPRAIGLYRASVRKTGYDLDLWVFFKTVHPSAKVIGRAQVELNRLQLPVWPRG
jgi:hypothetical protein